MLLSVSRRTDIPAWYSDWFLNRLSEGFVGVRQPYRFHQISRIPLTQEGIDAILFWSKDPEPLRRRLGELDRTGIPYAFQFTLNPYGRTLEPGLRSLEERVDTFVRLAEAIGPDRIFWRYDPIVLNESWPVNRHRRAFAWLCQRLEGRTNRCTISFVDMYASLRRVQEEGRIRPISVEEMQAIGEGFVSIGREHGMVLRTCCEEADLSACGILPGACIDREDMERLCGYRLRVKPANGQRPGCRCVESIDIGTYNTCRSGCLYCYATNRPGRAAKTAAEHDPASPLLVGWPGPEDIILEKKAVSLLDNQPNLYGLD